MGEPLVHPDTVEAGEDDMIIGSQILWVSAFLPHLYAVSLFFLNFYYFQGEMVQWTVFLISFWGDQIGQKVKKICDW